MSSTILFLFFVPILAFILLLINFIFAPHNPYNEKKSVFECGFHSFLGQNRTQFSISFFIFALLFLLFDLEILLVYPYIVSAYTNAVYGLFIMLIFFIALTIGLGFELGKKALNIDTRQNNSLGDHGQINRKHKTKVFTYIHVPLSLRNFLKKLKITSSNNMSKYYNFVSLEKKIFINALNITWRDKYLILSAINKKKYFKLIYKFY